MLTVPSNKNKNKIAFFILSALLLGTLRTYQRTGCDRDIVTLKCPHGTTISVQLANYGKIASNQRICPTPSVTNSNRNTSCMLPQVVQVRWFSVRMRWNYELERMGRNHLRECHRKLGLIYHRAWFKVQWENCWVKVVIIAWGGLEIQGRGQIISISRGLWVNFIMKIFYR